RNTLEVLELVPLLSIHPSFNHSMWFMDVYARGINGSQASWAAHKYKGHRILPESILNELLDKNIT
ncbi:hypothetical protein BT96DRAFT_808637, partial [Gymnopus androsaceus JB14]